MPYPNVAPRATRSWEQKKEQLSTSQLVNICWSRCSETCLSSLQNYTRKTFIWFSKICLQSNTKQNPEFGWRLLYINRWTNIALFMFILSVFTTTKRHFSFQRYAYSRIQNKILNLDGVLFILTDEQTLLYLCLSCLFSLLWNGTLAIFYSSNRSNFTHRYSDRVP
jgi:hypothetical protein